ncbi:penicillin-binding protein PBP2X [Streptococcus dentiloxodontae]
MKSLRNLKNRFLNYVVKDRRNPAQNRERVGQNLMLLSIFIFFVFIINFVIIIGTDSKFGVDLSEQASKSYKTTTTVAAKRGTIYDRNGNVLAEDSTTYSIYAIVSKTYVSADNEKLYVQESQYDKVAQILNEKLGIDTQEALKQLKTEGAYQVSFGANGQGLSYTKRLDLEKAFKDAGIKGMAFESTTSRMYPNGIFASEFLGLAQPVENKDGSRSLVGQSGLEASMNTILTGKDGKATYEKDQSGNTLLGTETVTKDAVDGQDVYTTLSAPLQTYLETQMDAFMTASGGTYASATLVNAQTGEILATSQRPTYNADTLEGMSTDGYSWTNMLYENQYEPGSTMKVMLLASAIDNGTFNASETFSNANGLAIEDTTVNDWGINEGVSTGQTMTFAQGFAYSSNVGMTLLEQKMGDTAWSNYLSLFKFGLPTRFGMDGESSGVLSDNAVNIAMSAFGQGISVTQAQMLRAFTAISNDGEMLEPQFVTQIADTTNGTVRSASSEVIGNPVSASAAEQTRNYMVTVGTDPYYGTMYSKTDGGPIIQVGDYNIAVKSGTAQIADTANGGYLEGAHDYIYSVVAMVPAENPKYIMYVTLQQPEQWSNSYYATVVTPVLEEAMSMGDTLTTSVKDTTSSKTKETKYTTGDIIGKNPGDVSTTLRQNLVHPIVLGTGGKIKKVSVASDENLSANQQILILTNDLTVLPDMYGWTKENVKTFADWTGIKITYKGNKSKTVTQQSVKAGTKLSDTDSITITLGD